MAAFPPESGSHAQPRYLLLGEVLRPHGVRGELRIRLLTDYPERIARLDAVYLGKSPDAPHITRYPVEAMRMHQHYGLLKLGGVNNRDQAEPLRELFVMVAIKDAVPLEDDEFYLYQIMGLQAQTESGEILGKISDIIETGANDVYVIDSPQYGEILIPDANNTIVRIDIEAGLMIVNLPEGLLPD